MGQLLTGRTALITGASSGIGLAVARRFAEGARIVIRTRRADRLERLADELRARGADVLVRPTDVTSEEQVIGLFADAEAFGTQSELRESATSLVPGPNMMTGDTVAAAITLMASLAFETNLLTVTMLPIAQPYLGRG